MDFKRLTKPLLYGIFTNCKCKVSFVWGKKNINNLATQPQNNVQIRSIWELNSTKGFDIELMTEITMSHDEEVIIVAIRRVN